MIAEKVPPKTITIEDNKNNVLNEPPSKKKAPKMEIKPTVKPKTVPTFFIICNQEDFC
jgi:hypothetical protein